MLPRMQTEFIPHNEYVPDAAQRIFNYSIWHIRLLTAFMMHVVKDAMRTQGARPTRRDITILLRDWHPLCTAPRMWKYRSVSTEKSYLRTLLFSNAYDG